MGAKLIANISSGNLKKTVITVFIITGIKSH
jgi:hypothetical protein